MTEKQAENPSPVLSQFSPTLKAYQPILKSKQNQPTYVEVSSTTQKRIKQNEVIHPSCTHDRSNYRSSVVMGCDIWKKFRWSSPKPKQKKPCKLLQNYKEDINVGSTVDLILEESATKEDSQCQTEPREKIHNKNVRFREGLVEEYTPQTVEDSKEEKPLQSSTLLLLSNSSDGGSFVYSETEDRESLAAILSDEGPSSGDKPISSQLHETSNGLLSTTYNAANNGIFAAQSPNITNQVILIQRAIRAWLRNRYLLYEQFAKNLDDSLSQSIFDESFETYPSFDLDKLNVSAERIQRFFKNITLKKKEVKSKILKTDTPVSNRKSTAKEDKFKPKAPVLRTPVKTQAPKKITEKQKAIPLIENIADKGDKNSNAIILDSHRSPKSKLQEVMSDSLSEMSDLADETQKAPTSERLSGKEFDSRHAATPSFGHNVPQNAQNDKILMEELDQDSLSPGQSPRWMPIDLQQEEVMQIYHLVKELGKQKLDILETLLQDFSDFKDDYRLYSSDFKKFRKDFEKYQLR